MQEFKTLSEGIEELKKQGYVEDFNLNEDHLIIRNKELIVFPSEFEVDKFYRFEDNTDPSDQAILYAISSEKYDVKGVLVNAYGLYSDPVADGLVHKLMMKP